LQIHIPWIPLLLASLLALIARIMKFSPEKSAKVFLGVKSDANQVSARDTWIFVFGVLTLAIINAGATFLLLKYGAFSNFGTLIACFNCISLFAQLRKRLRRSRRLGMILTYAFASLFPIISILAYSTEKNIPDPLNAFGFLANSLLFSAAIVPWSQTRKRQT
jgi:hypothetical protein